MTPKQFVDKLLLEDPMLFGRSRIQAVSYLFSATNLKWSKGIPNYKISNPNWPTPTDLWSCVSRDAEFENFDYPIKTPTNTKEHQLEQTYLNTHSTHWRQIFGWDISPKSAIWDFLSNKSLEVWKEELLPTLWFWATQAKTTEAKSSTEAALLLGVLAPEKIKDALYQFKRNQDNLEKIKAGKKVNSVDTLKALGWDLDAHKEKEKMAAKKAVETYKELVQMYDMEKNNKKFELKIYQSLLKSNIDLKNLNVNKEEVKKLKKSQKFYQRIEKDFPLKS